MKKIALIGLAFLLATPMLLQAEEMPVPIAIHHQDLRDSTFNEGETWGSIVHYLFERNGVYSRAARQWKHDHYVGKVPLSLRETDARDKGVFNPGHSRYKVSRKLYVPTSMEYTNRDFYGRTSLQKYFGVQQRGTDKLKKYLETGVHK